MDKPLSHIVAPIASFLNYMIITPNTKIKQVNCDYDNVSFLYEFKYSLSKQRNISLTYSYAKEKKLNINTLEAAENIINNYYKKEDILTNKFKNSLNNLKKFWD